MKKLFTGFILLICILAGGEAFPKQLSVMKQAAEFSGGKHVKAEATRAAAADIITEAPAGTHKSYYRDGTLYSVAIDYETYDFVFNIVNDQYVIGEVVEGNDGFFYFKNPVIGQPTYSYMKGEKEGDEIVFHLPQPIAVTEDYSWGVSKMRIVEGGYLGVDAEIVTDNNEIRFKINEDGSYTQIEEEGYIMGYYYMDDDNWTWLGTSTQTYYPFDAVSASVPADAEIREGQLLYEGDNGLKVKMAVAGDNFYLGDVYPGVENGWVVGKIADGRVTFDSYQYLGASEADYHYLYFVGANVMDCESEQPSTGYASLSFNYDTNNCSLTPLSKEDAIVVNASAKEIYYLDYYANPSISPFTLTPATPINPEILDYQEYWDYFGYAVLDFRLPLISKEGNLLDKEHYFYNIYIDDEAMEFYPDEYPSLTDVITDIPYSFNDEGGIGTSEMYILPGTHEVVIYSSGYDSIGVQGLYTVDGVTNYTDIVYYGDSGVKEAMGNAGEIGSVEFYDLTGRKVSNPTNGIFIKKTNYTDGTAKVAKISVK